MMAARRVYVVEDEEPIRRSLHLMLRVLGYEAQLFESGASFLAALPDLASGCVLLDLRMPLIDGLEVQRRLAAAASGHSVVMMSGHGDLVMAVTALEQGAVAFLDKPFSRAALEQALHYAFLRLEDLEAHRRHLRSAALAVQRLNATDRKVLELMARGHDTEEIVRRTGLAEVDVDLSRSRIFTEFSVETITEALHVAFHARRGASL